MSSARHEIGRSDHTARSPQTGTSTAPATRTPSRTEPSTSSDQPPDMRRGVHDVPRTGALDADGPRVRAAFASPFVWNAVTPPRRSMSWIRCMTRACPATGGVNKRTSPTRSSPRGSRLRHHQRALRIAGDIEPDSTGASRKRCVAGRPHRAEPQERIAITAIAAPCAPRRATARIVNEGPPSRRCPRAVPAVDSTGRRRAPVLVGMDVRYCGAPARCVAVKA